MSYIPPTFQQDAFHCPNCQVYARQNWGDLRYMQGHTVFNAITYSMAAICEHCKKPSIWHEGKLVVPQLTTVAMPSIDLPESCKTDYLEARAIVNVSARGAAALLRLCIQKLLKELGEQGKNINDDIASLVKKGLPAAIQQSLDVCRVVGNNAVHPGEINLEDTPETVLPIFQLINFIVHDRISRPKEVEALFNGLPAGALEAIKKRDNI